MSNTNTLQRLIEKKAEEVTKNRIERMCRSFDNDFELLGAVSSIIGDIPMKDDHSYSRTFSQCVSHGREPFKDKLLVILLPAEIERQTEAFVAKVDSLQNQIDDLYERGAQEA